MKQKKFKLLLVVATSIILLGLVNYHIVACMVFETHGSVGADIGWHYPCGELSKIENKVILAFGGFFGFQLLLLPVVLVVSYLLVSFLQKLLSLVNKKRIAKN